MSATPTWQGRERLARGVFRRAMKDKTLRRLLRRFWPPVEMTVDGHRYELHPADNATEARMYMTGAFDEPDSLAWLLEQVRDRRCLVHDIGANCGAYAVPLAAAMADGSVLHCFEPSPIMAARLGRNLALNGLESRAQVHEVALGASAGEATLHVHHRNHGQSSLRSLDRATGGVTVPVRPLADYAVPTGPDEVDIRAIKIDVEGREDTVLAPYLQTVDDAALADAILIETVWVSEWQEDLRRQLAERGYVREFEAEGNEGFVRRGDR